MEGQALLLLKLLFVVVCVHLCASEIIFEERFEGMHMFNIVLLILGVLCFFHNMMFLKCLVIIVCYSFDKLYLITDC